MKYTHVVVLDFEATCDDRNPPQPQEVIEFPSVLLALDDLETVAEFESFVRPLHHPALSPFCRSLTSIQQSDVDAAPPFGEVLQSHESWLDAHGLSEQNTLFVTCGDWDLAVMLPAQCRVAVPPLETVRPIYAKWLNVKRVFCSVQGLQKAPGLKGMLAAFGLSLRGHHHRGIDDCRNIAELLRALVRRGARVEPNGELPAAANAPNLVRELREEPR